MNRLLPVPKRLVGLFLALFVVSTRQGVADAQQPAAPTAEDRAAALQRHAKQLWENKDLIAARDEYVKAVAEFESRLSGHEEDPRICLPCCRCRNELTELEIRLLQFTPAKGHLRATFIALQLLAEKDPRNAAARFEKAHAFELMSLYLHEAELSADAVSSQFQAIEVLRKLAEDVPERMEYRLKLELVLTEHGAELMQLARYPEAEAAFTEAVRVGTKLVADFSRSPEPLEHLEQTYNAYALLVRESGRFGEAADMLRETIRILRKLEADYPDKPEKWRHLPTAYRNLAQPLNFLHRDAEAEAARQEAARMETKLAAFPDPSQKILSDEDRIMGSFQNGDAARFARQHDEVDRATQRAEKNANEHPDVPAFQSALAAADMSCAMQLIVTGSWQDAERRLREGLSTAEKLARAYPDVPRHRRFTAELYPLVAMAYYMTSRPAEGEAYFQKGFAALEQLANDYPRVPRFRYLVGEAMMRRVMLLGSRGQPREAAEGFRAAMAVLKKLADDFPTSPEYRRHYAASHLTLAGQLAALEDYAGAEAMFREGVRLLGQAASDFPKIRDFRVAWGNAYGALAVFLAERQKLIAADEAYAGAIRVHEGLAADFPEEPEFLAVLAADYFRSATAREKQRLYAPGVECSSRAIAAFEAALKSNPRKREWLAGLGANLQQRAGLYEALGKTQESQADSRRAREIAEGLDSPFLRLARIKARAEAGNVVAAVREAEDLFLSDEPSGSEWFELARFYAGLAAKGPAENREAFAGRAAAALVKAGGKAYVPALALARDPQFEALRGRADFDELAAKWEKKAE